MIGLILLNIEARMDLPDEWWVYVLFSILLVWTGYGAVDKYKRNGKKQYGIKSIRIVHK